MISQEQRNFVIELWRDTLKLEQVDLDRGFADLGGNSLAANQFVARLEAGLGFKVPVIRVFEYPTLRMFLRFLVEGAAPARPAAGRTGRKKQAVEKSDLRTDHDIAIVGMACRFPGARNIEEFWANLLDGRDTIRQIDDAELSPEVPATLRDDPRYVRACGLIDDPYGFDAEFFAVNPMEAKLTDPQQRVLLEVSWHALEHAGETPGGANDLTAVFAGVEDNSYYRAEIVPFPEAEARAGRFPVMTGNEKDYVAMRIAHKLNLKGPAVSVHTACSTSLVAVIMACKSLRLHECDRALAGGASVHFPTPEGYYYQEGGVFSSDGHCRPFDKDAQGTNFTDGAGMVVLKRVEDAVRDGNTIFAVIKGGAINSDGGDKVSFSAPSIAGQAACIRAALADADVDAGTLQFVEAHGTATPVGDPIEMEALRQAFAGRQDPARLRYCGIGSVKSNIGHTTAAAGVASLIKTALALRHGVIPATVHFRAPNPGLNIDDSPFFVVGEKMDWPAAESRRRAGISSFGIGGTNSHLIVEEAPPVTPAAAQERPFEIWPVSARVAAHCRRQLDALSNETFWPRDIAHTLQSGRAAFRHRGARVRLSNLPIDDLVVEASHPALDAPSVAFMFPGQGAQYVGMGKSLYDAFPEFRATFERCCELLSAELKLDFKSFIFDTANQETLENTRYTQPAIFAIEVSLGRMLLDWGLRPERMVGHSIGEFAAAHLAGVFSLEDGIKLIAARGRLMADLPRGRMLSVRGATEAVTRVVGESIEFASINSPIHSVLSGSDEQIAAAQAQLEAAGLACRPLHTSHAFHSAMMSPVVEPFLEVVRSVSLAPPRIPIVSTVTGAPMRDSDATDPYYWANHLRATVRFSPALFKAIELGSNVLVEVGPRTTLATLAVQHFPKDKPGSCVSIATLAETPDPAAEIGGLGSALARLWCAGVELPWEAIWRKGRKVPLVSRYPFEHRNFRFSEGRVRAAHAARAPEPVEPVAVAEVEAANHAPAAPADRGQLLAAELARLIGEHSGMQLGAGNVTFVEAGLDSLVLMQIGVEIGKVYGVSVSLRELMNNINTLPKLAAHVLAQARPERLEHLVVAPARAAGKPALSAVPTPAASNVTALAPRHAAAQLPSIPLPALQLPALGADNAGALHQQLSLIRDLVAQQLSYLEGLRGPGSPPASAEPTRPQEAGPGARLIRARRADPPAPGAFRAAPDAGAEWYRFEDGTRRYKKLGP